MTPAAGARLTRVLVDGRNVGALRTYTFRNVRAAHTIRAEFYKAYYTITASASSGGSVSPRGTQRVANGGTVTYRFTPASGYELRQVLIDGEDVGAVRTYTFRNVTDDHQVSAVFGRASRTATITASAGPGGSISPSGTQSILKNGTRSATYRVTPDPGYAIADVVVDGVSAGAVGSYTFRAITADHSIEARFRADGAITVGTPELSSAAGASLSGGAVKSGYGIGLRVPVTASGVSDLRAELRWDFGEGEQTLALERDGDAFVLPVSPASPAGYRAIYIPAATPDGSYVLAVTVRGTDGAGSTLTRTVTATVTVLGSMYEDDFTGDA